MSTAFIKSMNKLGVTLRGDAARDVALSGDESITIDQQMLAFNALPDCVSIHKPNGMVFQVSSKSNSVLGVGSSELMEGGFLDLIHVQDRVAALQAISDCAWDDRETVVQFRITSHSVYSSGGIEPWFEMRCSRFSNAQNLEDTPLVLVTTRDISEQHQLEAQAADKTKQAEAANLAKSRFLSVTSHELRTPLNAIMGFSEMLQGKTVGPTSTDKQVEYADLIHQSASHLLEVLNGILDISKIEAGKYQLFPEPFDLRRTIHSCIDIMQPIGAERSVDLVAEFADELPELTADPRAVRQILLNLLANAIKFSSPGCNVVVRVKRKGRKVVIDVIDTGMGMAAETVAKLGEPFYQADDSHSRRHEGTGLGLSIVYGLVKLHDGEVRVESAERQGTTVTVTLPITTTASKPVPFNPETEVVYLQKSDDAPEVHPLNLARKIG